MWAAGSRASSKLSKWTWPCVTGPVHCGRICPSWPSANMRAYRIANRNLWKQILAALCGPVTVLKWLKWLYIYLNKCISEENVFHWYDYRDSEPHSNLLQPINLLPFVLRAGNQMPTWDTILSEYIAYKLMICYDNKESRFWNRFVKLNALGCSCTILCNVILCEAAKGERPELDLRGICGFSCIMWACTWFRLITSWASCLHPRLTCYCGKRGGWGGLL